MGAKLYPLPSFLALKSCQANTNTIQRSAFSPQPFIITHFAFQNWKFAITPCAPCSMPYAFPHLQSKNPGANSQQLRYRVQGIM
jgi:hypothetical protein